MQTSFINTRADLDAITGTPAHDTFMAALAGSVWRLEKNDELKTWKAVQDTSTIERFGFALADFADVPAPGLPVYVLPTPEQIQAEIVSATQARLDDFAKTRGYDGILSACTYATSTIPKFAAEGQYCVGARDATWGALYALMDDVMAGKWQMPAEFADVEPLLPALGWPA